MATLYNTKISATYEGLIKTTDNAAISATLKQLTDGSGNATGLYVNNAGDFKVNAILEWGSLKDTGTGVTITQWVTAANGIENFNNDTTVPTSAAVKTYVDGQFTIADLDFLGDTGNGQVDLDSQNFSIEGTLKQITTLASNQTIKLSLPNNVEISGVFEGTTFVGDLNGTINTDTTAVTQTAGDNSTKVATTSYVDTLDSASDLDFSGDSGSVGAVNLNTQTYAVTGTANQIETTASGVGLSLSLPATVHRNLQGNVQGDLTGNVTATSVLADGVTATTQASSDSSTKVATTAYVKGLDNASDLDITGDTGTGDVNLNTQTLNILGTTNEITTAVVNQTATISLPSSISVNVIGNVTGALTGNADTATTWETARDLSLTGQATATLSNVDGALAVSGAVTLDNNSVTGKVLTGLPTPAALTVSPTDSILEGIGKLQSQINGLANGLQFQGSWDATNNTPVLGSGGGEANSGTTTSTATNKLIQTGQNFTSTVTVGDKVINQVDRQTASVTNIDSNTTLSIDADIMLSGEAYTIDNTPFITQGHYYVVNVGGTTQLNGISEWSVGDWVIAGANNEWTKLDHTDVEGTGTAGNIAKWSATGTIADSRIAESGTEINVNGSLNTTTNLNSGSDFAVAVNKFTANGTTGAVSHLGNLAINTNKFTVNATSGNTLAAGTVTAPTFIGDLTGTVNATSDLANGVTATTQSANDASTKVATTAYADAQAGFYLPLVGGIMTGNTIHNDNVKSIYGTASDGLEIYHDANHSVIKESGTGDFRILSDSLYIKNTANSSTTAIFTSNVQLYESNSERFRTTSTGVSITGDGTFTENVNVGGSVSSPAGVGTIMGVVGRNGVGGGTAGIVLKDYDNDEWDIWNSGGGLNFRYNNDASVGFGITSTGATTFAGDVTLEKTANTESVITLNPNSSALGTNYQWNLVGGNSGTSYAFQIREGATSYLSINNSAGGNAGNVTFAGDVALTGSGAKIISAISSDNDSSLFLSAAGSGKDTHIVYGGDRNLYLSKSSSATAVSEGTPVLTLASDSSATFAGNIILNNNTGELQSKDAAGVAARILTMDNADTLILGNITTVDDIRFDVDTYGEAAMMILSSGKVGIGIISPEEKLMVAGQLASTGSNVTSSTAGTNRAIMDLSSGGARMGHFRGTTAAGNGYLGLYTDSAERMKINAAGNVTILNPTATNSRSIGITNASGTTGWTFGNGITASAHQFVIYDNTAGLERMRVTSVGNIHISGGSYATGSKAKMFENNTNTVDLKSSSSGTGLEYHQEFANPNSTVGSITTNASATAFNTTSDYRLKEDLQDFNGLDKVSKIKMYDFKWKTDENRSYGVMAHELQEVLPQAVSGEKDAEKMQQVDYSKIVPLLVKSIQELKAEVDLLKSNKCNCKN